MSSTAAHRSNSKYRADIKCHERRVILHTPTAKETTLYGIKTRAVPRVVSAMKTMKMLRKEKCMGFLVNIVGSQKPEVNIADVPKSFLEFHPTDK
ncbi:hypothetical protein ACS0TY_024632 [Phlomoides rotata]